MTTYYNEFDPFAAQWLRNLIDAELIPAGHVDDRSIKEVTANDLRDFEQAHFFAGIAGWPEALRLAGWTGPCWTGSPPCQPFSVAGQQKGVKDERHLWPEFFRLIRECKPPVIFGEQVNGAIAHGWLDDVFADLESEGYACGAAVLGAHSVGLPHVRKRIFFVGRYCGTDTYSGQAYRWHIGVQVGREQCQAANEAVSLARRTVRPAQSRPPIVAYGVPFRVEQVCAYGNAIVPQVAAEFIRAFMECP